MYCIGHVLSTKGWEHAETNLTVWESPGPRVFSNIKYHWRVKTSPEPVPEKFPGQAQNDQAQFITPAIMPGQFSGFVYGNDRMRFRKKTKGTRAHRDGEDLYRIRVTWIIDLTAAYSLRFAENV